MKALLFFSLLSMGTIIQAAEWKVVAETVSCPEKISILAKEGESYVIAENGSTRRKLYSQDGSSYSQDSIKSTSFNSDPKKEKYLLGDPTFSYSQPSVVERNPPKLEVTYSGRKENCRMMAK